MMSHVDREDESTRPLLTRCLLLDVPGAPTPYVIPRPFFYAHLFFSFLNDDGCMSSGYLWLSCESNETRGELVEHLCLWFQSQKEPRRSSRQGSCGRMTPAAEAAAAIATAARAMHEAAAAVSAAANTTPAAISAAGEAADLAAAAVAAAKVAEEAATLSGSNTEEDGKGSGSIQAGERLTSGEGSNGLDVSLEEQESEEDREADVLEVDQILMKDLLDDLGEERSLNVTALLLANAEELAPPCARGDDAVQKC